MRAREHMHLPVWIKAALIAGIASPLVYLGVIVVGGALRPGYSHLNQAVSELTEAGAGDRFWLTVALTLMELFTIAFGLGFFAIVRRVNRKLATSALMLVAIGVVGLGFARYPMDPVGSPMTPDGRMHLIIVAISALAAIASVVLAGWGWLRVPRARRLALFTFAALFVMLASGVASGVIGVNAWPGIGLCQRINTAGFGLWQIVTALHLLRHGPALRTPDQARQPAPP